MPAPRPCSTVTSPVLAAVTGGKCLCGLLNDAVLCAFADPETRRAKARAGGNAAIAHPYFDGALLGNRLLKALVRCCLRRNRAIYAPCLGHLSLPVKHREMQCMGVLGA